MAKNSNSKKRTQKRLAPTALKPEPYSRGESRGAELGTVAWMVGVLAATLCETLTALAELAIRAGAGDAAVALGTILFLASLVFGTFTLIMTPLVLRARKKPPPPGVTAFALLVGALPWIAALVRLLL